MGKVIVTLLATVAVLWIGYDFIGGRMANTAVSVPATTHTGGFGITWTVIAFCVVGLVVWRTVKGK